MESEKEIYKRDGFIVLRDFFTESETKDILDSAQFLFNVPEKRDSYMKYYETVDGVRTLARIEKFYDFEPRIMSLVNMKIRPTLSNLEGWTMTLFKDKLNWKLPGGGAFKPHQDFEAYDDFPPKYYTTVAVFADECTIENGCLEMVRNGDKEGVLKNTNGCINDDIVASFNWEPVLVKPGDMVIFNALVPHRSGKNVSDSTRRVFYFTFNKLSEGIHYFEYFKKKREVMPPDIDRDPNKKYNTVNKYNLANPID